LILTVAIFEAFEQKFRLCWSGEGSR